MFYGLTNLVKGDHRRAQWSWRLFQRYILRRVRLATPASRRNCSGLGSLAIVSDSSWCPIAERVENASLRLRGSVVV